MCSYMAFVLLHFFGKGFVIKEFVGPSCQLSTFGFNYKTDGGENMSQRIPWHLSRKLKLHNLYQKYFVPLVSIDNV